MIRGTIRDIQLILCIHLRSLSESEELKVNKIAEKFKNKYRNESARLKNWDYSANGLYFITICTVGRKCIFGNIENGIMFLSEIGIIADQEWNKSFKIRAELFCDAFVIMPNHIHAILRIEKIDDAPLETRSRASLQDVMRSNNVFMHGLLEDYNYFYYLR